MENFGDEYNSIWETNMFFPPEELDSYFEDQFSAPYYYSSSPDGTQSLSPGSSSKNILSERNRRKKLNERLYALRSVVPNITKMDKASIIKDAIGYIQTLHEEERRIQAEIAELESGRSSLELDQIQEEGAADVAFCSNPKRSRLMGEQQYRNNYNDYDSADWSTSLLSSPIEVLELRVSNMGEKTVVVSLTCSKRTDTMVKLCEMFETLKLKIITASITAFSGRLTTNVFLEADEEEKDVLRLKIEAAIAALNDPDSPMTMTTTTTI